MKAKAYQTTYVRISFQTPQYDASLQRWFFLQQHWKIRQTTQILSSERQISQNNFILVIQTPYLQKINTCLMHQKWTTPLTKNYVNIDFPLIARQSKKIIVIKNFTLSSKENSTLYNILCTQIVELMQEIWQNHSFLHAQIILFC